MLGKCYLYALETLFDLHTCLSSATVAVGAGLCALDLGSAPSISAPELGNAPVLVHGFVLGDFGELKDIKFGHAWLEGNGYVMDCGSAKKTHSVLLRDEYYEYWRINSQECHRYTIQQATQFVVTTGWDSGWNDCRGDEVAKSGDRVCIPPALTPFGG